MTASGAPASRAGTVLARVGSLLCLAGAVALVVTLLLRPSAASGQIRRWAWVLVVVLAVAAAVVHAYGQRRARPGRFLATSAGSVAVLLMTYVLAAAPAPVAAGTHPAAIPAPYVPPGATGPGMQQPAVVEHTPVIGVSTPTLADFDSFIRLTGTRPEVLDVFQPWSDNRPLDLTVADAVAARGTTLSITWEPWDPEKSHTSQPAYRLSTIIDGLHDGYIDEFAASVKAFGKPVQIRLMHEMNGNWYPWGGGVDGNTAAEFVQAWRHVVDRFRALGVTNVSWMWAPNAVYTGAAPLAPLYPGDAYVDEVGLSNYNWGDQAHDGFATTWESFGELFDASIAQIRQVTVRPVWIAEVASTDDGGSKAAWIAAMFQALKQRPGIAGLVWFDREDTNARADWRIETEPDAVAAWRAGMAARTTVIDTGPGIGAD